MPYKDEEEKKRHRNEYVKEYMSRPEVQERIKNQKIAKMGYVEYDRRFLLSARLAAQVERFNALRQRELNESK
tara:strand:+ start:67 stop:285 length:219 start_codon:yes stop_codon:yes gene_type:complete